MVASHDEEVVRDGFWSKIAQQAARVPFADQALAAWYCANDANTPVKVKATLFAALAYFVLPFDVIPDFILGLGFTDDMAVLVTAVTMMRAHITSAHRDKARDTLAAIQAGGHPSPNS